MHLEEENVFQTVEDKLKEPQLKDNINIFQRKIRKRNMQGSPKCFLGKKKHVVELPFQPDFKER